MKPLSKHEEQQLRRIRGPFAPATSLEAAHRLLKAVRKSAKISDTRYKARKARNEVTPAIWQRKNNRAPSSQVA